MILESKGITYETVDITEPGKEDDKEFMQKNSKLRDENDRNPLPPQIFNDTDYCGVSLFKQYLYFSPTTTPTRPLLSCKVFVVNEPVGAASFVGLVEPHSGCICSALMHQLCGLADGSVNSLTGGVLNFFALYGALPPAREEKADFCVCLRILYTVHHLFAIRFQLSRFLLHSLLIF